MATLEVQADYIKKAVEMVNSSGTGASVVAFCPTVGGLLPATGLFITALADQQNPISMGQVQLSDATVAPNGQGVTWTTPNFMDFTLSVIANSADDYQLFGATQACRKRPGGVGTPPPIWTFVVVFPNAIGQSRILQNCIFMNAEPGSSMGANGRINCKNFQFRCFGFDQSEGTGGF